MKFTNLKLYNEPSLSVQNELIKRPCLDTQSLADTIDSIFKQVALHGDQAIKDLTSRFDKIEVNQLQVTANEISEGSYNISAKLKTAIDKAYANIYRFHKSQKLEGSKIITSPGVECWQEMRAIETVGLYIPGGSAPLFSTVLMLGIPAQIAGCSQIILCTPPDKDGKIHPAILYAAHICDITTVFRVGGAQAIAAMALGTQSIPPVYKVFGPGNQYVTAAKMKALEYNVAIDLPAGPSEVLVYADHTSRSKFVAADLLSQAEHGPDSQVVLVAQSTQVVKRIDEELKSQLADLPRRDIAMRALQHAYACIISDVNKAFQFINRYAPEHLIISSDYADSFIRLIQNAGSVFIGHWTPESAGDYASGTNHTLPTSAFARAYSGVSLDSFVKKITLQKITQEGISSLGSTIMTMAEAEELMGHSNAVKVRMQAI